MTQQPRRLQPIHVELLCGGTPAFMVALQIKEVLENQRDVSCKIIHIDRGEERAPEDTKAGTTFLDLEWNDGTILQVRNDRHLNERVGQDQIERVIKIFSEDEIPLDYPMGGAPRCAFPSYPSPQYPGKGSHPTDGRWRK